MKTNHKETFGDALIPLLRYVNPRSLAFAMFVALALLGTTRGNETEKTGSAKVRAQAGEPCQGSLAVYSATDGYVRAPVMIKEGRRTILDLDL
jgi:hypothetical protein